MLVAENIVNIIPVIVLWLIEGFMGCKNREIINGDVTNNREINNDFLHLFPTGYILIILIK